MLEARESNALKALTLWGHYRILRIRYQKLREVEKAS